jgi:hypothetical protein
VLLLLTLLLAQDGAPAPVPPPVQRPAPLVQDGAPPTVLRHVQLDLTGFADDPVLAALRLRLPDHAISRHADRTAAPDLYLRVERTTDTTATMQAITADGRAYDRTFSIEIGHEVRAVATTAVNLLFAIQHGTVPPDQQGVVIPDPTPPPANPPPSEPTPPPEPRPPTHLPALAKPPARPTPELALLLHGATVLGLGPPQQSPLAAAGGGLGLELRTPRGLAASLELRAAGIRRADLGLARMRVALGAGYILRRKHLELPLLLVLSVEPWWPLQAGAPATVQQNGAPVAPTPLLSAHLRVAPGVRLALPRGHALRIGPRLELGGGFIVADGARVVSLDDTSGTPRARLGGLELSLGLELAVQFSLPRRP